MDRRVFLSRSVHSSNKGIKTRPCNRKLGLTKVRRWLQSLGFQSKPAKDVSLVWSVLNSL